MIRLLSPSDIPGCVQLKEAAGWNQTEQDWAHLLELEPEGCFGLDCDGRLAASATAVCYGRDLAWIGMVLTLPDYRGRGFARRLMEHALDFLRRRGVAWVKLDATDMGRPLYAKLGFEDECAVERWGGVGRMGRQLDRPGGLSYEPALDCQAFGADRAAVIHKLERWEAVSIPGEGYAMGRPGTKAFYFGPCVARTPDAARRLLESFLARHAGEPVFWDLLPGNAEAVRIARDFGFEPRRHLVRMALPGAEPFRHDDNLVYGSAGFEYG